MLDYLKLSGSLFFITLAFIFNASAQTLKENKSIEKDAPTNFFNKPRFAVKTKPDQFAKDYSGKKSDAPLIEKKNQPQAEEPNDWKLLRGNKSFSIEYGVSPFNPSNFAGPKQYDVYGRDLHLFSLRVGRIIGTKNNISYEYMFGVTPLAIFTKNEVVNPAFVSATATPNAAPTKRETTYGIGIQPINFKFMFFAKNRLKPYAQIGGGLLFTNRDVPTPAASAINFTGNFGGGLMYMLCRTRAVSLGYKYFHISNGKGFDTPSNPGYNANVFYIEYSFLFR